MRPHIDQAHKQQPHTDDRVDLKEGHIDARQVVGLATGTGVGPLYGYFRYVLENNLEARPLSLFVGFREEVDIGPREQLDALAAKYSNFEWRRRYRARTRAGRACPGASARAYRD